jgi:hypothetical protein
VKGINYVQKDVTLSISDNVTLLFEKNATIRIDGALKIQGKPNSLINITSADKQNPGNGLVINGVSPSQDIIVDYVRFDYLKKPITFEFRWSRNSVAFTNNIIKHSLYEGAAVEIKEIDNLLTPKKIYFDFKGNTFSNSTSSILISNITSDLFTMRVNENVITRNEYTGRTRNGLFTSPLYMTYNRYQSNEIPILQENSVFDNFYSLFYADTFDIGRTNVSIIGNADQLNLSNNYFGDPSKREIEETFDFISANYQAPFLYTENTKTIPPSFLNGHFYEAYVNGEELDERALLTKYKQGIKNIELRFNRPVVDGQDFQVLYHFLRADTVVSVRIKTSIKFSEGNQFAKISFNEKLSKYSSVGYVELSGLYDSDGMDVPILTLGKKSLQDDQLRMYVPQFITPERVTKKADVEVSPDDTLVVFKPTENTFVEFQSLNDSFVHLRKKYWSAGFFAGNAIYFGDLNSTTVSIDPRRMRPNLGLRLKYQATEKFSLGFSNNNMIISGSDNDVRIGKNVRGTKFDRNLSFRTTIIDAAVIAEYNFTRFKLKSSIVPSIFAGGNVYYFKPEARVNGEGQWYNLREIGTEGQTLNGATQSYEKIMYGIPMGASLKKHLTQRTIVSLSYTYNKIFTDYLDDVSTGVYPEPESLKAVNANLSPDAVVSLSNPGDLKGPRSFSDDRDGYGYWGISFMFKLY